jgi:sulfate-transporting ATPase
VGEVFRFALLGLGAGALYALSALGLVIIFRSSGVVNFAQGAMGMAGAYLFWELRDKRGMALVPAMALGILFSALIGLATHVVVMRQLRNASNLTRVIATLAIVGIFQAIAIDRYGVVPLISRTFLPAGTFDIFGQAIGRDRVWIFILVLALSAVLWVIYRFTRFGLSTTAVAEDRLTAQTLAISPDMVAGINWAIGAALAGLAAELLAPITTINVTNVTVSILPVLAAAVIGGFASFPLTLLGGLFIGITESLVTRYVTGQGWITAVPFLLVAAVLVFKGRSVPSKSEVFERLPSLGNGRIHWRAIIIGVIVVELAVWIVFPTDWITALNYQIAVAVIFLSLVVVAGYAGQLSLMQFAFAGIGALVAGRLIAGQGWPFLPALIAAMLVTVPVAVVVGLCGVRTRGVYLAIVSLGFAVSVEAVLFNNQNYTGGLIGTHITPTTIFGFQFDPTGDPASYTILLLFVLVAVCLVVANLRRGRTGRRLIAVRSNERAAAALGVSVVGAKLYAFVLSGMIAALGGVMFAFRNPTVNYSEFGVLQSIIAVQGTVIGGIGWIAGPLLGSGFEPGTLGTQVFAFLGDSAASALLLVAGFGLLFVLVRAPNGLAQLQAEENAKANARFRRLLHQPPKTPHTPEPLIIPPADQRTRVQPRPLQVQNLTIRFGGVTAVDQLNLTVEPGEIVGLIGPNGAGKSTTIDAITGFVNPTSGTILLGDRRIDRWTREKRARSGLGRSFQSLELFEEITVRENILAACEPRNFSAYLTDLIHPGHPQLTPNAMVAIDEFGLIDDLTTKPTDLHFAKRRLVAVARAVAASPSILLLDEPAASLDDIQTQELSELLKRLAQDSGMGILLVEHDVGMVLSTCDRVYALDFGRCIANGTPTQIRNDPQVVEAYLGTNTTPTPTNQPQPDTTPTR